jgi:Flp pilus assembly protein TadD
MLKKDDDYTTNNKATPHISGYISTMHRVGKAHFDSGNYKQALSVFRFLCLSQPTNYNFFLALAITQTKLKLITNAISSLSYTSTLTKTDPRATLLLAKLLLTQNQAELAKQAAESALAISKQNTAKWQQQQNKAKAILAQLANNSN